MSIKMWRLGTLCAGPLRKRKFTLMGSKGHGLLFEIGGFWSVLCVSVFQGSLLFNFLTPKFFYLLAKTWWNCSYASFQIQKKPKYTCRRVKTNRYVLADMKIWSFCLLLPPLFDKHQLDAMITVWLMLKKNPKWEMFLMMCRLRVI